MPDRHWLSLSRTTLLFLALGNASMGGADAGFKEKTYAGQSLQQWRERIKNLDPSDDSSREAITGLLQIVRDEDVPWFTRRQAALTLGRIGRPADAAVPVLTEFLRRPGADEQTIGWVSKSLALYGPIAADATPDLVAIATDRDRPVAERAPPLEALAQIGTAHRDAIPTLTAILAESASPILREFAAESFIAIGPAASSAVPALTRALQDPVEAVRRKAAAALGALQSSADIAVPSLRDSMIFDDSLAVRDVAAQSLSQIGPAAVEPLTQLFASSESDLRRRAALALGNIGGPADSAVPALVEVMNSCADQERIVAAAAIWQIRGEAKLVLPTILWAFQQPQRQIRMQAFKLFVALGEQGAAIQPQLKVLARYPDSGIRLVATKALESLQNSTPSAKVEE